MNWSRRQDSHPHWTRSELAASALGYAGMAAVDPNDRRWSFGFPRSGWCSRQDLHLRPAGSKPAALVLLSYGSIDEIGGPGWICAINLLLQRQALYGLSDGAVWKWSRSRELHPLLPFTGRRHHCLCLTGAEMVGHVRIARLLSDPNGVCSYHNPCPGRKGMMDWWDTGAMQRT